MPGIDAQDFEAMDAAVATEATDTAIDETALVDALEATEADALAQIEDAEEATLEVAAQ